MRFLLIILVLAGFSTQIEASPDDQANMETVVTQPHVQSSDSNRANLEGNISSSGTPGPQGPTGAKGDKGDTGSTGVTTTITRTESVPERDPKFESWANGWLKKKYEPSAAIQWDALHRTYLIATSGKKVADQVRIDLDKLRDEYHKFVIDQTAAQHHQEALRQGNTAVIVFLIIFVTLIVIGVFVRR